jgi:hypothetical protein
MDFFIVVLLILVIVLIINNKSSVARHIEALEIQVLELKRMIEHLRVSKATEEPRKREEVAQPVIKDIPVVKIPGPPVHQMPPVIKPEPEPVKIEKQPAVISDSPPVINRPVKTSAPIPPVPRRATAFLF